MGPGVGPAPGPGSVGSHRGFWPPGDKNMTFLIVFQYWILEIIFGSQRKKVPKWQSLGLYKQYLFVLFWAYLALESFGTSVD